MRRWRCRFLGDDDDRAQWEDVDGVDSTVVESTDASSAARKALAIWRREDAAYVRDEGWYGEGTIVGVQEIVDPPPVRVFVKQNGRLKMAKEAKR